jgi:hypothetical protein
VYVVADQTYWLAGADIMAADVVPVLPYGAVEGTGRLVVPDQGAQKVWWFSHRGLVVGNSAGQVANLQEKNVSVEKASVGAALYREQNGVRQVVSSLFGAETSRAAASSFMSAEIIRKESML